MLSILVVQDNSAYEEDVLFRKNELLVGWANKNPVIMIIKYSTLCCLQHADDENYDNDCNDDDFLKSILTSPN